MAKNDDFELDFDFEKEYGFAPEEKSSSDVTDFDDLDLDGIDLSNVDLTDVDLGEDFNLDDLDLSDLGLELDAPKADEASQPVQSAPAEDVFQAPREPELPQVKEFELDEEMDDAIKMMRGRSEEPKAAPALPPQSFVPPQGFIPPQGRPPQGFVPPQGQPPQGFMPPQAQPPQGFVPPQAQPAQEEQPSEYPPRRRERGERRENPLRRDNAPAEIEERQESRPATPRRKKPSTMRKIKDNYLPMVIAGLSIVLCLVFIIVAVSRSVERSKLEAEQEQQASEQAAQDAIREEQEAVQRLRDEAAALAAGYDFQGAIEVLDSFPGDVNQHTEILSDRGRYAQLQSTLVEITDYSRIPNLSFHALMADYGVAFNSGNANSYKKNFVAIEEFRAILQQLYDNGYVLVNFNNFIEETVDAGGNVTLTSKPIYLPQGKKPVMLTETLVNYFGYMVDGNEDGVPDAQGEGFACKLVLRDGKIVNEMVNFRGETVYGDYDLVPILNSFIEENPDFAYRGARATLAVTGSEGIFGYRLQTADEAEIAACKELVQELRNQGYLLACNSFVNVAYNRVDATYIQNDIKQWKEQIVPVIGEVDIMVYAAGSDIDNYNGSKFNVMQNEGFRYFISSTNNSANNVALELSNAYLRQYRIMVTGSMMVNEPNQLMAYFNPQEVLITGR